MGKLLRDVHHAILVVTEDTGWLRPFLIVGWWISLIPKLPMMLAYEGDDDDQHYPGR